MKIFKLFIILIALSVCASPSFAKKETDSKKIPHGLQKKVDRGQSLPPGWQKKLEVGKPVPSDVREHEKVIYPVDKNGVITIAVDDKVLRLINATNEIVEILK